MSKWKTFAFGSTSKLRDKGLLIWSGYVVDQYVSS
jgi:hypothetical protein